MSPFAKKYQGYGDSAPGGPESAHQIVDTGAEKLTYRAVSSKLSPAIVDYPDSGQFGVLAEYPAGSDGKPETFRFIGRASLAVNYWEGE